MSVLVRSLAGAAIVALGACAPLPEYSTECLDGQTYVCDLAGGGGCRCGAKCSDDSACHDFGLLCAKSLSGGACVDGSWLSRTRPAPACDPPCADSQECSWLAGAATCLERCSSGDTCATRCCAVATTGTHLCAPPDHCGVF